MLKASSPGSTFFPKLLDELFQESDTPLSRCQKRTSLRKHLIHSLLDHTECDPPQRCENESRDSLPPSPHHNSSIYKHDDLKRDIMGSIQNFDDIPLQYRNVVLTQYHLPHLTSMVIDKTLVQTSIQLNDLSHNYLLENMRNVNRLTINDPEDFMQIIVQSLPLANDKPLVEAILPNLNDLTIIQGGNPMDSVIEVLKIEGLLPQLVKLDLMINTLNDPKLCQIMVERSVLFGSPSKLTCLKLSSNDLRTPLDLFKQWFDSNPNLDNLIELDLSRLKLISDKHFHILANSSSLKNLETLRLPFGPIGHFSTSSLQSLLDSPYLLNLTSLPLKEIKSNGRPEDDQEIFVNFFSSPKIQKWVTNLELSVQFPTVMTTQTLKFIARSPYLSAVKSLTLENRFGSRNDDIELLTLFCRNPSLSNLTSFDPSGMHIGDDQARVIASSQSLQNLTRLKIGPNSMGDQGIQCIMNSLYLTKLKELDVGCTCITDDGLEFIAQSPNASSLTHLSLIKSTHITIHGIELLSASPFISQLEWLGLSEDDEFRGDNLLFPLPNPRHNARMSPPKHCFQVLAQSPWLFAPGAIVAVITRSLKSKLKIQETSQMFNLNQFPFDISFEE